MIKTLFKLYLFYFIINIILAQKEIEDKIQELNLRSLKPIEILNSTNKYATSLKLHSKILQTVYSESYSKNYYYTTLYVGENRTKQTYIIDTGSSIMSSVCSPCKDCGKHKTNYYGFSKKKDKPLKCDNKVCKMLPATNCKYKKDKDENKKLCSFDVEQNEGEGIKGFYLNNIVYFEVDKNYSHLFHRQMYRSYALPVGCTTEEYGKYKELNVDGIMGVNYNDKSFISLLYKLKIINRDIFSLCFGLRGGYMSLGEIDTTFHKLKTINYVPLISSNVNYLIKVKSILIGNNKEAIKSKNDAIIDTGNTISYFPSTLYKSLIKDFNSFCNAHKGKCGEFKTEPEYGYCASFKDRESLFDAIYFHWPNITLELDKDKQYIWKPINYYYYYLKKNERKACLGFNIHKSQNIILGTNFIHGHDIIFDRAKQKLGFVPADCSRGNILWKRNSFFSKFNLARFVDDPKMIDKEIHKNENEGKFGLGDNNNNEMLEFIQGHNTELDFGGDFRFINFIILLTSVIIVVLVIIVVISALLCNKRGYLRYDEPNNIEYIEETYEENNSGNKEENVENKIVFEDSK